MLPLTTPDVQKRLVYFFLRGSFGSLTSKTACSRRVAQHCVWAVMSQYVCMFLYIWSC